MNAPSNPDDPQAGYGYIPNDTTKEETLIVQLILEKEEKSKLV